MEEENWNIYSCWLLNSHCFTPPIHSCTTELANIDTFHPNLIYCIIRNGVSYKTDFPKVCYILNYDLWCKIFGTYEI